MGKNKRLYDIYRQMKYRCYNNKIITYRWYGEKGITVCKEWLDSFENFLNWSINNNYNDKSTIDRINNDGNYEPSNCQFITQVEQVSTGKRKKFKNNKSGYTGVCFRKDCNKWASNISFNKKLIHLGYFNTKEEALQARINAEIKYFGEQKTNLNQ